LLEDDTMARPAAQSDQVDLPSSPVRIALIFLVAGIVWTTIADFLLYLLPPHSIVLNRLSFVSVTTVILYLVARAYARRLHVSIRAERASGLRAQAYFRSAAEGIIVSDRTGTIRQINPCALGMFGYSEAQLLGGSVDTLVPARARAAHGDHRVRFFQNPGSRRMGAGMDPVGVRRDGSEFPIEVSLSHIRFDDDDLVVAFLADVSARRAIEREARRAETLNALGAVAAGIAHELNNPLAVISSRIELMLDSKAGLPAETVEDLRVLQRNVERAARISRHLLSLARQRPSTRHAFDINSSIEEVAALVIGESRTSGIQLALVLDRKLPHIVGDQVGLEQVVVNLLSNARDAAANRIRIGTEPMPGRDGWIRITVGDNGIGISTEARRRMFEPFFTSRQEGTGLGLWLSQRVIDEHGGSITAQSDGQSGTTFEIELPIEPGQRAISQAAAR
jgi:PAS domain S-box-containing protein